ncbi:protein FAR1-RELATED SEQUENCE 5-like [Camellia sinensis]|uniref:protein FAR1-RELATED SEQUENCE 5-like n=1 Tax=Camellia sinensis TaxID=4442 RepID=UPI0010363E46|nr:protein FAR1-RELATED SEQUENCE 5-like [Camellia sinensis]
MMPSQRKLCDAQGINVDVADNIGISLKASHDLISALAGGKEFVGFTREDQKTYLRAKRQRNLQYGEAGSLLRYFQQQAIENPYFYFAFQLDVDEMITNIFWADHQMITDFGIFASFEWLFETFLHAMSGKKPDSFFTDQDQAMAKAISKIMPEDEHKLVEAWDSLIHKYNLQENLWIKKTWELREKWAHVYMKLVSTTGMRNTPLSESLNAELKRHLKVDHNIVQFFTHFNRVVMDKRYEEVKAIYDSRQRLSRIKLKMSPMLIQVAKLLDAKDYAIEETVTVVENDPKLMIATRYRDLCPRMVKLAARSSKYKPAYQLVDETLKDLCTKVDNMMTSLDSSGASSSRGNIEVGTKEFVVDPNFARAKGLKKKEGGHKGGSRLKP